MNKRRPFLKSANAYHTEAKRYQAKIDAIKKAAVDSIDMALYHKKCREIRDECLADTKALQLFYGKKWKLIPDYHIKAKKLQDLRTERLAIIKKTIDKNRIVKNSLNTEKAIQWRRRKYNALAGINRVRKREAAVRELIRDVCEFFNTTPKRLAIKNLSSDEVLLPRRVFFKYGIENRKMYGSVMSRMVGLSKANGSRSRLELTRSFQTNPDAKRQWTEFVTYMNLKAQNGLKKAA